ncbi:MAG TPA: acetyl-CoA carboxylase biotin carboxyl carrier protein [Oligoflexia bacterium]|nr:acetyl-CoA carboxylase biotin carboxyl carrier protein [Oligoflexia bacterium]HMP27413.1 acetyl-CoA carboxylase biotin carboxyl carrier protein [Oligoflexia bacterium]
MDLTELEKILDLLKKNEVNDFELEREGVTLKLSRGVKHIIQQTAVSGVATPLVDLAYQPQAIPISSGSSKATNASEQATEDLSNFIQIKSPLVGTFYRRPSPDAEPYAKEGDIVKKGQPLCIVEAMKLMNQIEATADGKIEKILPKDGEVVEFGEVLFLINPNS